MGRIIEAHFEFDDEIDPAMHDPLELVQMLLDPAVEIVEVLSAEWVE